MIALGIDIGLTGAIAAVDSRGSCTVHDLPVVDGRIHGRQFLDLVRSLAPAADGALAVLEDVRPRPANGGERFSSARSQVGLLCARGACQAVLDVAGRMQVHYVQPQVWKRGYGLLRSQLGKELTDSQVKAASLAAARRLYPMAPLRLAKHHNRAEALLIAHYGLREMA